MMTPTRLKMIFIRQSRRVDPGDGAGGRLGVATSCSMSIGPFVAILA
jgi:hypothetical protein